ncbi:cupin domain-containing protein [Streptomyces sp. PA03-5A]|nr:cupin domain-containing protein [Streptomyces sp. PA03-5A]
MSIFVPGDDDPRYTRRNGIFVPPGEGDTRWVSGDTYTLKAGAQETNGALTFVEATVPPGAGAYPHLHHQHDEAFYIISGELEFLNGDQTITAGPGSFYYVPRSTRHRFVNKGVHSTKMIFMFLPGGIEELLFENTEKAVPGVTPPDPAASTVPHTPELMVRFGTEVLPGDFPTDI